MNSQLAKWIKEYFSYMKYERGFAKSTINGRMKLLKRFARFLGKRPLSTESLREFIRMNGKKNLSPVTINDYIKDIKCFCKYLYETGKTPQDYAYPLKKLKVPFRPPTILSLEEVKAIIDSPLKYKLERVQKTYYFAFELLAKTGMRRGEFCSLDFEDFHFNQGLIHIRFAKGGKQRWIPLPQDMSIRLQEWFQERELKPNDPVFVSRDGNRMQGNTLRFEMKRRAKAAGITKRVYPHLLRHSYITEMLRQDVAVAKVARIVGHANPMITLNTYEHLVVDDLKEAALRHPLIEKPAVIEPEEKVQEINYVFIRESEALAAYFQNPFKNNSKIFPNINPILSKQPS